MERVDRIGIDPLKTIGETHFSAYSRKSWVFQKKSWLAKKIKWFVFLIEFLVGPDEIGISKI